MPSEVIHQIVLGLANVIERLLFRMMEIDEIGTHSNTDEHKRSSTDKIPKPILRWTTRRLAPDRRREGFGVFLRLIMALPINRVAVGIENVMSGTPG